MTNYEPQKIIVPVDFSELSIEALERAMQIATEGTAIHMIHVIPPLSVMEPGVLYGKVTDEARIENAQHHMQQRLSDAKYSGVVAHACVGDPGREIVSYADRESADLIVISSHGLGFLKHLLIGSVAERVVRLAHCTVMVLKGK